MSQAKINIKELLGSTLDSRDEAEQLFIVLKDYQQYTELALDFSNVDFMSRSFADQFYKERMNWETENSANILIENASTQIIEILHAVSKTQASVNRKLQQLLVYSFSKEEQLSQYLQAL